MLELLAQIQNVTLTCHAIPQRMEIVRRRFIGFCITCVRNPCTVKRTVKIFCRSMSIKALTIKEFGDSSKLQYGDIPKPEPAEGEVASGGSVYVQSRDHCLCIASCLFYVSVLNNFGDVSFLSNTLIEAKNNIYNKEINNYHF